MTIEGVLPTVAVGYLTKEQWRVFCDDILSGEFTPAQLMRKNKITENRYFRLRSAVNVAVAPKRAGRRRCDCGVVFDVTDVEDLAQSGCPDCRWNPA